MFKATEETTLNRMLPSFEIRLQSTPLSVRSGLSAIIGALQPLQLDPDERAVVELVLAEALNNVVEHAYQQDRQDGPIRVVCTHDHNGLHLNIWDAGQAMKGHTLPFGNAPVTDCDLGDMPEGGFGWFLIRDLAKDVRYHRENGENQLELRLAIATH